jgi:crossover junction endodeoxyribonuclease RusA
MDNAWKVIADSLTKARVWQDDSLIKNLSLEWGEVQKGGRVELTIAPHGERIAS